MSRRGDEGRGGATGRDAGARFMARVGFMALTFLLLGPGPAQAQAPLFLVNSDTRLSSVKLEFPEGRSVETDRLKRRILLRNPGFGARLKGMLDFLPLISSPRKELFHPPELLRDRTRLERFYREAGFPEVRVEYDVRLDTLENQVDVTFLIHEGPPRVLDSVQVLGVDGDPLGGELPPGVAEGWRRFLQDLHGYQGERLGTDLQIQLQDRTGNWLRNRGYPFPRVTGQVREEGERALLTITAVPGRRLRVGELRLEGADVLSQDVLRREVPLEPGDWFSQARLAEGEREVMGLGMVRYASLRPVEAAPGDSVVNIRMQVDDGLPHLLSGQLGYTTQSGLSGDASWSHRNFLGGARILEISASARTGLLGPEVRPARRYGLSVLLRQPYLFHRRLAGLIRPFTEYRDDLRDRSLEGGLEGGLIFERGPRRTVSLRYSISYRKILDARPGVSLGQGQDLVDLITSLDTLDLNRRTSRVSLATQWGGDKAWNGAPLSWDVQSNLEVAGPPGLSTIEYGKMVLEASAGRSLQPWMRLSARAGVGRVFPWGVSVPAPDGSDRLEIYLKLRDATLTAGGSQDVRGWGRELLGPKIPDLAVDASGEASLHAGTYIPLGGLARWTGSVQVEFPMPHFGWPHGTHIFLDGGRIWTPDGRFLPTEKPLVPDQEKNEARFGVGGGISISTPVGPLQIDLGYKLNPSLQDVRDPGAVARALAAGESIEAIPEDGIRRWHLHFSIGRIR